MQQLLFIITDISLPILILIALGFGFQKLFKTDLKVLPRLLIYLILPATVFVKIMDADITWALFGRITAYVALLMALMYAVGLGLSFILKYAKGRRNALTNAMMFTNSGNYGLPLIELTFGANPLTAATQLIVVILNNILRSTIGVFSATTGSGSAARHALKNIAKMPTLYAIALAFILKALGAYPPEPIMIPLQRIAQTFIALALIALGMQLSQVKLNKGLGSIAAASLLRVLISPAIGFGLVLLLGIDGILAQALIIGAAGPVAVNTVHVACEFDNEPEFAAEMVLVTTLLVTFTMPLVIWFVQGYFQ